jgi:trans-aconitate 2-methyltransferase
VPWDPDLYLRFAAFREQPARDLLARLDTSLPAKTIYDLGCGTGAAARSLAARWPAAEVIGLDASEEMLTKARSAGGRVRWIKGDAADADLLQPADVVFSNAVFNWIADHAAVLPPLFRKLQPGGQFALQVPRNYEQPSHALIAETINERLWRARLGRHLAPPHVLSPEVYYRILGALATGLEIWETNYVHRLEGVDPVFVWLSGTALRPILDELGDGERQEFEASLQQKLRRAYPRGEDGYTLFAFRRLFIYARR